MHRKRSKKRSASHRIAWKVLHRHFSKSRSRCGPALTEKQLEIYQSKLEDLAAFVQSVTSVLPEPIITTTTTTTGARGM